jgi:succinyl-diaminopimelate desuccinylase
MSKLLPDLIKIPNISNDLEQNQKIIKFCQEVLKEKGISSQIKIFAGRPTLVWGADLSEAVVMINSHLDIVPGPEMLFAPIIEKDKIIGRGAADTKAAVSAILNIDTAIQKDFKKKRIIGVLVTDEEIGGDSTKALLAETPKLDFAIFGEPTALTINNQAKGIIQVKVTAWGKSTHGSRPWLGKNAISIMAGKINTFMAHIPTPAKETFSTTYSFAQIKGGIAINQVPASCELLIDIRFNPHDDPQRIVKKLSPFFKGCKIEVLRSESPIFTSPENKFVRNFEKALKDHEVVPKFSFEHGSSDARHCTARGIASIVFGPIGGGLHEDIEWVDLKSVTTMTKVLESFINKLN